MVMWLVSGIPPLGLWEEYCSTQDGLGVLFYFIFYFYYFFFRLFMVWCFVAVFSVLFLQECSLEAICA